jgi:hypothetical protein
VRDLVGRIGDADSIPETALLECRMLEQSYRIAKSGLTARVRRRGSSQWNGTSAGV